MYTNKPLQQIARIVSLVFHPLMIPTIGFLLLLNSDFYFALLPWTVKRFILFAVFLSTGALPMLSIGLLAISPKFDIRMTKNTDRVLPLVLSAIFSYMGYLILRRIAVSPIFNLFLIASILVQVALLVVSLKWKISAHAAAIGSLVGGFFALSFRLQENPVYTLTGLILIAGVVCSARLILRKHTRTQVYAGFSLGFLIMNLIFLLV